MPIVDPPPMPTWKERSRAFRLSRNGILFFVGLVGIVYETVWDKVDRPTLLVLFAAMVGLPAFLSLDESKKKPPDTALPSGEASQEKPVVAKETTP